MSARKPKPRPVGRPKSDNPANMRLHIRVTEEQRATYLEAAEAAGLTLTAWIEKLCDRASGRNRN